MGTTVQKKRVLFIDRDGTLIEEPSDEQIDSFEKLSFYPDVFSCLGRIAAQLNFELVMVTNQDGLGTEAYPEDTFWPIQKFLISSLENEGIVFSDIIIDRTFPADEAPTRKPGTALLQNYLSGDYDLEHSYVIGDRLTDIELAKNLGCKGIFINSQTNLGADEINVAAEELQSVISLETSQWHDIYKFLLSQERTCQIIRETKETRIEINLNIDGDDEFSITTIYVDTARVK